MLIKGIGLKPFLIALVVGLVFTIFVTAVGNDVFAVYGGVVVFVAICAVIDDWVERRDVRSPHRRSG